MFLPRIQPAAAGALLALSLLATAPQAAVVYANFDPLATAPVDYDSTEYADLSGRCSNLLCTGQFNMYSAGFTFTAASTLTATRAYVPLRSVSSREGFNGGMERFYRVSIYNMTGELMVQGGLLGRHVPVGRTGVYEFELNRLYEAGQTLAASGELIEGQSYRVHVQQRFGALSTTYWLAGDDDIPAAGQAWQYCTPNTGSGYCATNNGSGWRYPFGQSRSREITDFLPALALTDSLGFTVPPPVVDPVVNPTPEPGSLALAVLALLALARGRARRGRR